MKRNASQFSHTGIWFVNKKKIIWKKKQVLLEANRWKKAKRNNNRKHLLYSERLVWRIYFNISFSVYITSVQFIKWIRRMHLYVSCFFHLFLILFQNNLKNILLFHWHLIVWNASSLEVTINDVIIDWSSEFEIKSMMEKVLKIHK